MNNKTSGVVIPTFDTAIDSSMVQNTRAINVPPTAPFTDVKGMLGEIEAASKQFTQAQEQQAKAAQSNEQTSLTELLRQQLNTPSQAELQNQAYGTKGGVNDINMELATLNGNILKEQNALTRRLQALEKNPEGLFGGALQQEMDRVERESLAKQADMYVIQQGIQGRFTAAKDAADRAIQARMAYDQRLLNVRQTIYERNKDLFDKTEQRAFEAKQFELQTTIKEKQNTLQQISDLSLNALQNGAPSNIAAQMRSASTVEDAMRIGGQYVGLMDRQLQNAQLANIYDQMRSRQEGDSRTTGTVKPPTEFQQKSLGYAERMNESNKIINNLGSQFTGVEGYISGSSLFPNALKSSDRQSYEQAQRDFINAVLRRESGATITDNEFANAQQQYFPQPGDTQDTVLQKNANRNLVINSFFRDAGVSTPTKQTVTKSGKAFDVEGARAAGYTQEEIDQYINNN